MFASSCHVNDGQTKLKKWQLTLLHLEKNWNSEADVYSTLHKAMLQMKTDGMLITVSVCESYGDKE